MNEHAKLALPPADLMYRVAGTSNPDWFVASGRQSVKDINNALGLIGRRLSDYKRISISVAGAAALCSRCATKFPSRLLPASISIERPWDG